MKIAFNKKKEETVQEVSPLEKRIIELEEAIGKEEEKKFDALERYLQIELVVGETSTQTYDWADKQKIFEFRKCALPYEKMKAEKEKKSREEDD